MSRWSICRERPLLRQAPPVISPVITAVTIPLNSPVEERRSSGRHVAAAGCMEPGAWAWILRRLRHPQQLRRHRALRQSRPSPPSTPRLFRLAGVPVALSPLAMGPPLAVADLPTVIGNATNWLIGILAVLATFFLTLGGARYLTAGGDPAEVEKAKTALKSAGIGYGLALLAPVILQVLQQILGASK